MRSWVPVPGTTKGRLVEGALAAFGARGFAAVGVTELAESAGVTIGSLYHHFGSKAGLYTAVREDVERRVLDRMEGAAAVAPDDLGGILLVGFDYLVGAGLATMLAEPHPDPPPERAGDPIEDFLAGRTDAPTGHILVAAWRAALAAAPQGARDALRALLPARH